MPELTIKVTRRPMLIYLMRRHGTPGLDEHDAFVIAARDRPSVIEMTEPIRSREIWTGYTIRLIGTADPRVKRGIILDSFRAG